MSELADAVREVVEASPASPGSSGSTGPAKSRSCRFTAWPTARTRSAFTADTRVGVASGAKGFTALTVMRLVEDGVLALDTRARELLGDDLPLIDDARDDRAPAGAPVGDRRLPRRVPGARPRRPPARRCRCTSSTPPSPTSRCSAGSHRPSSPAPTSPTATAGTSCWRCSPSGPRRRPFHDLVQRHVIDRAGLTRTAYLRSDALPGDAALGYLHPEGHDDRAAHQRAPPAGRRRRRRRHLHDRRRPGDAVAGAGRRPGRGPADLGGDAPGPQHRATTATTASASGSRATPSTSPARTPGRRSRPSTCPAGPPGRCSATPPRAPGRWCGVSTSCSRTSAEPA